MSIPKLPKTVARLATSITIKLIPEDTLDAGQLSNPAAILTAVQNTPIGAVQSLTESNDRPAHMRFEMDYTKPGVVTEVYPGLVQMRTVRLTRVVLYDSDVTQTFVIENGDVVFQYKPFALIKIEAVPEGSNQPTNITIYRKCWLTTNPKAYTLGGGGSDLKIVQDVNIAYTEREVVEVAS